MTAENPNRDNADFKTPETKRREALEALRSGDNWGSPNTEKNLLDDDEEGGGSVLGIPPVEKEEIRDKKKGTGVFEKLRNLKKFVTRGDKKEKGPEKETEIDERKLDAQLEDVILNTATPEQQAELQDPEKLKAVKNKVKDKTFMGTTLGKILSFGAGAGATGTTSFFVRKGVRAAVGVVTGLSPAGWIAKMAAGAVAGGVVGGGKELYSEFTKSYSIERYKEYLDAATSPEEILKRGAVIVRDYRESRFRTKSRNKEEWSKEAEEFVQYIREKVGASENSEKRLQFLEEIIAHGTGIDVDEQDQNLLKEIREIKADVGIKYKTVLKATGKGALWGLAGATVATALTELYHHFHTATDVARKVGEEAA